MNISSILSVSLFLVKALTSGTAIKESAMAATPISGDLAAAAEKPELIEITSVEMLTVRKPARIPAYAPIFVMRLEKRPKM